MKILYNIRFEMFFSTLLLILFGSLIFPASVFNEVAVNLLFSVNIALGLLLAKNSKPVLFFLMFLLFLSLVLQAVEYSMNNPSDLFFIEVNVHLLYFSIVTFVIINQVWRASIINRTTILGLISGYISLGLVAFLLSLSVEYHYPNSYQGLYYSQEALTLHEDTLMYYAYITLLTIGYGEITPTSPAAQKAAILIGLAGQLYLVIFTAIIIGKYLQQTPPNESKF